MFKNKHAASDRSPLRRRFERAVELAALIFFVVLGSAIYQNVSKGTPPLTRTSAPGGTEARSNNAGPGDVRPAEGKVAAASPNEPTPVTAPPVETKPSGEGPSVAPSNAPPTKPKLSGEGPSTTGTIKPEPEASLLSPAPLDCEKGSPTFWEFANVELIDSASARASSLVTSCRVSPVSLADCQNAVIVGVGMASSRGVNATEAARALRRGINLVSALRKDLQARCTANVTVSAYVLNLGRYNDERDEPDQRRVIALVATGSNDADKAAADAVVTYARPILRSLITRSVSCTSSMMPAKQSPFRCRTIIAASKWAARCHSGSLTGSIRDGGLIRSQSTSR